MTGQKTGLSGCVSADPGPVVESDTNPPQRAERRSLVVVAESADGNLSFDPVTGSFVVPEHWLPTKEIN